MQTAVDPLTILKPCEFYNLLNTLKNEFNILCNPSDYKRFSQYCETAVNMLVYLSNTAKLEIPQFLNLPDHSLPSLNICYYGDNEIIHKMVTSYCMYRILEDVKSLAIDYRFIVLPNGCNYLAQYLAMTDKLYRRTFYTLFTSEPIIPSIINSKIPTNPEKYASAENPELAKLSQMKMLFQSPQFVSNYQLFKVKCWKTNPDKDSSDINIPFLTRVELGSITGTVAEYGKPSSDYLDNITKVSFQKSQYFSTGKVKVQYKQNGDDDDINEIEEKSYTRIVISNMPNPEDHMYNHSKPTEPSLHCHMIELLAKFPLSLVVKGKDDYISIRKMMVESGDRFDVDEITIVGKSFPILVDDQLFGPFCKIVVKPLKIDDELEKIPILHFMEML